MTVLVRCAGKGAPLATCDCAFCRALRPPLPPPPERIGTPTGDFEDES